MTSVNTTPSPATLQMIDLLDASDHNWTDPKLQAALVKTIAQGADPHVPLWTDVVGGITAWTVLVTHASALVVRAICAHHTIPSDMRANAVWRVSVSCLHMNASLKDHADTVSALTADQPLSDTDAASANPFALLVSESASTQPGRLRGVWQVLREAGYSPSAAVVLLRQSGLDHPNAQKYISDLEEWSAHQDNADIKHHVARPAGFQPDKRTPKM